MTLPAGQIAMSDINAETGRAATTGADLNWVKSITKGAPATFGMDFVRSKAYYQRNADGNCNNGNCNCNCDCGNIQCLNCRTVAINCANCDGQPWIQANCNCACTYNCNTTYTITYNCNCDCNCTGRC